MNRMLKWTVLTAILAVAVVVCVAGCRPAADQADTTDLGYKIGIVTGTVSQGEDEYRAAERVKAKYGDSIIHVTYPDNFMQEQETTISQIIGLAAESDVKAIIVCQGVPGTAAAIDRIRQTRPDMLIIVGVPHEDPMMVSEKADVALETDNLARGRTIVELAHRMGATAFLHYSFPRHMSYELLAKRRDIMEETCERLGMEFIFATAPDPMGPDGIPGTQKFIIEDVPLQVNRYGTEIAVFATNCAMQEPLIKACLDEGAFYPEQCCPSPTHGYPGALGIDVKDMAGDIPAIIEAIDAKIVELGGAGRFATWPIPVNMLFIEAGVEIARNILDGKLKADDMSGVKGVIEELAGVTIQIDRYHEDGNFFMIVVDSVVFGEDN